MTKFRRRPNATIYAAIGCSLAAAVTAAVTLVPDSALASTADREAGPNTIHSLNLEGMPNARDLGGYRTSDGGAVRYGLLFRSGKLNKLTTGDKAQLASLHLNEILDLRTPEEEQRAPDPTIDGATYLNLPIIPAGDPLIDAWDNAATTAELRTATDSLGGPDGMYLQIEHQLVSPHSVAEYRAFFQNILAKHGAPVLFHCTLGQDRTGLAAYLTLRILGVSRGDAMQDYVASAKYNADTLAGYVSFWESLGYSRARSEKGTYPTATLMDVATNQINSVYGNFDTFVRDGLGLTDADVQALRDTYVTQ